MRLRRVPLRLHAHWQSHAHALLREYLLARLDDTAAEQVLQHAASSDALALLAEQLPPARPTDPPDPGADATVPAEEATARRSPSNCPPTR